MKMESHTHRQYVELFHLLFLTHLGRKLDKTSYALKGGSNLRFYFKSLRYSEDIDFDVQTVPIDVLRSKVSGILDSKPFRQVLEVRGMAIEHVTESKQTATTQRWKLGLYTPLMEVPLPTKIEFSRRANRDETKFEGVDPELIRIYQLSPIMANHYSAETAFRQKMEAIVSRSTPQARDVFDLHLLLTSGLKNGVLCKGSAGSIKEVQEKVMSIDFHMFKSQVLAYLHPEYQVQYNSQSVWENMVLEVVESLRGARS